MKRYMFDLAPFEKEIQAIDGTMCEVTGYGKVLDFSHFDEDELKPIKSNKEIEGVSKIVEYTGNSLPHELNLQLSRLRSSV